MEETEIKYDSRQPRDDMGRWSSGSGGISVGHALHVARHEGIEEKHHAGIEEGIRSGKLDTREKVLAHIDAIHDEKKRSAVEVPYMSDSSRAALTHLGRVESAGRSDLSDAINQAVRHSDSFIDPLVKNGLVEKNVLGITITDKGKQVLGAMGSPSPKEGQASQTTNAVRIESHSVSDDEIRSGRAKLPEKFSANLASTSGRHVYNKSQEVDGVTLKLWENPSGGEPRVYISGEVSSGTAGQRGSYDLGHLRYEDGQLMMAGGRDVAGMKYGIPEGEHRTRIHAIARKILNHHKSNNKSLADGIMEETLINFGGEIKTVEETETGWKFGGYLVVFDSHDISRQRDKFTKSTDFDIEDGDRISLFYNHGLDGTVKRAKMGTGNLTIKDAGVWLEGEIKKRTDYLAQHAQKIGEGLSKRVAVKGHEHALFGLSSGALSHMVERVPTDGGHEMKMWKIGEASITPTPAEPLTSCMPLKSLVESEGKSSAENANDVDSLVATENAESLNIKTHDFKSQNEVLEATEAILRERMPFEWHLNAVRSAVKGLDERMESLIEVSCVKAGRVLSTDNHSTFTEWCESLEGIAKGMREKLELHAPEQKTEKQGVSPETMKAINAFLVRTAHIDYSQI